MGTWGAGLYESDLAEEVKDKFIELVRDGENTEEATNELVEYNREEIDDPEDGPVFWLVLADTQWKLGRLQDFVKEKALHIIENDTDLKNWLDEDSKHVKKRIKILSDLSVRLKSPMPKEKKLRKSNEYICDWLVGDAYAYKLTGEESKKSGLYGKYAIVIKVDEGIWHPKHRVPIVRVKIVEEEILPKSNNEFDKLKYFAVRNYFQDDIEIDQTFPVESVEGTENRKTINQLVYNELNIVHGYLLLLAITSRKQVSDNFVFLGNFSGVKKPVNEYIPNNRYNIAYVAMQNFEHWLNLYSEYNLDNIN
ncbi:MAG: hypothetical protein FD141_48 [Fusobacteria bacterium]|nr:MAG: hypothetical protein FD141_48 [Fusobacteriota bacterium]KAF0229288.1 MAG: hypothetical protein FD182_1544 [Fusobacteriota bacterium]